MPDHESVLPIAETVLTDLVPVAREIRSRPDFDHKLRPAVYSLNKYGQTLLLFCSAQEPSSELTRALYADGRTTILPLIDTLMDDKEDDEAMPCCLFSGRACLAKLHHDMETLVAVIGCGLLRDSQTMGHA
ncbi:hypothetical protein [Kordiimonas marina]|uniref:hypothetical protein n=1 Tax=Kordiimonas marina TaxID=2872312 RepID=UPI001FF47274|nr:hypothetical protein [Kordiimonas marina]MCJ9429368.1 hypothetical protein [Kordiimonas marina]